MATHRTDPPLAASEADTLRGYLAFHRDTLRLKTEGLNHGQLAQTHPPSTMTLGGLLKHLALNDDWWFIQVLEGRASDAPWVEPGAFDEDADWEWHSATNDSLRWLLLHMIEEYSRHNGHADLLREAVDGQVRE